MADTITITTKSLSKELNKWQLANHGVIEMLDIEMQDNETNTFDRPAFEATLRKVSHKISAPDREKKET